MAKSLFPNSAYPACRHCIHGRFSNNHARILCIRKGIVELDYSCKKYRYDPLKRVPARMPSLPSFDRDDFKL